MFHCQHLFFEKSPVLWLLHLCSGVCSCVVEFAFVFCACFVPFFYSVNKLVFFGICKALWECISLNTSRTHHRFRLSDEESEGQPSLCSCLSPPLISSVQASEVNKEKTGVRPQASLLDYLLFRGQEHTARPEHAVLWSSVEIIAI